MRNLINNPVYMTYEEMEEKFNGKWILITNCNYTEHNQLLGGVPVAVADKVLEGQSDGFYDRFKEPQYAPIADRDFDYESVPEIVSVFNILELAGNLDDNNAR